jgi:adenylate kinase family enzyme
VLEAHLFLGPPAVGKGYIRSRVAEQYGLTEIEVKALIKRAMSRDSAFHDHAMDLIGRGILIEDHYINEFLGKELDIVNQLRELVIDGSSRNRLQAEFVRTALLKRGFQPVVMVFEASYDVCRDHLDARIMETISRGEVVRADDEYDTHRERYDLYVEQVDHVLAYFGKCGTKIVYIDASKSKDEVYGDYLSQTGIAV